jgi:hypothetical protein
MEGPLGIRVTQGPYNLSTSSTCQHLILYCLKHLASHSAWAPLQLHQQQQRRKPTLSEELQSLQLQVATIVVMSAVARRQKSVAPPIAEIEVFGRLLCSCSTLIYNDPQIELWMDGAVHYVKWR